MTTESKRLKEEAKKYGIPVQSYALATLMAAGWTAAESYALAYYENAPFSATKNAALRSSIVENPNFKDVVDSLKQKMRGATSASTVASAASELSYGEDGQLSKMELATLLRQQIDALPDGKEKAGVLMQYATLFSMQKKEEEKDDEEKIIHVYIPLTCQLCPKYEELKNEARE